jgi:hypothetical protein
LDDKLIKEFLLKDFETETMSETDWLIRRRLKKDSKKIPSYIELKKSRPQSHELLSVLYKNLFEQKYLLSDKDQQSD